MPCTYDPPSHHDIYVQNTGELVVFVKKKLNLKLDPREKSIALSAYASIDDGKYIVPILCSLCKKIIKDGREDELIWNGRDANSRRLADWWELHQKDDAARKKKERRERKENALRKSALDKLSNEEKKALRIKG